MPRKSKTKKTSPRSLSAASKRSPKKSKLTEAQSVTAAQARLAKLLKRAVTITRELNKLCKMLGVDAPRVTVKVKR